MCLRLLTVRARSRAELAQALSRRGVDDDVAAAVLDRLVDVRLFDDAALARAVVDSQVGRGLARRAVAGTLRRRGIADPEIAEALEAVPAGAELAAARRLAARSARSLAGVPPEVQARRLAGRLARRGHGPSVVHRVVRETVGDLAGVGDDDAGPGDPDGADGSGGPQDHVLD